MLMLNAATSFDFIVMVFMTIRLVKYPARSSLWHLLFRQGVIYFLVAFLANLIPGIFSLLNLSRTYYFLQTSGSMLTGNPPTLSPLKYSSNELHVQHRGGGRLLYPRLPFIRLPLHPSETGRLLLLRPAAPSWRGFQRCCWPGLCEWYVR